MTRAEQIADRPGDHRRRVSETTPNVSSRPPLSRADPRLVIATLMPTPAVNGSSTAGSPSDGDGHTEGGWIEHPASFTLPFAPTTPLGSTTRGAGTAPSTTFTRGA